MIGGASEADPFFLSDADRLIAYTDPAGKTQVGVGLIGGQNTLVLIAFGQSKADNVVLSDSYATLSTLNHNFSIYSGGCYRSATQLLGNSLHPGAFDSGACYLTRLADMIIAVGTYQRVILVPLCVAGVSIAEFATGGAYSARFGVTKRRLDANGLAGADTKIYCDNGETDAIAGMSTAAYKAHLEDIRAICTDAGLTAPMYVASTAYHWAASAPNIAKIVAGQAAAVNGTSIFAGPNLDSISPLLVDGKRDATSGDGTSGVHFTGTSLADGATDAATLAKTALGL